MKTPFTILMISILLSFSYGQQNKVTLHQEGQAQNMVSKSFLDHPNEMIQLISNQFKNKLRNRDAKQKLDSVLSEYNNFDSWELRDINYYEYDDKGNNIKESSIRVGDTGTYTRDEFSYDSIGRLVGFISESNFLGLGEDKMSSKVVYDDHLKYITTQMDEWDESIQDFTKRYLSEVYYSDTTIMIPSEYYDSAFVSEWNVDTQEWERFLKETVSILENGSESIEHQYMLEDWKVVAKTEVIVNDEEITTLWSQYDYVSQIWTPDSKIVDLYLDGNLDQSNSYHWNSATENWDTGSQDEFTFNFDYSINDLVLPLDNELYKTSVNMLSNSNSMQWYSSSEEWVSNQRDTYYYSTFSPTGIDFESEISTLQVYPNPASDVLKVSMYNSDNLEAEIYNIHGRLIKRQSLNSGEIISIADIKPGVYLLKAKSGNKILTTKFIKK